MPKKKEPWGLFFVFLLAILVISYYVSGVFRYPDLSLMRLEDILQDILAHPFRNYWNEKSFPCIALGALVWLYIITDYLYHNRNFMFGKEHGSAAWSDPKALTKKLADKDPAKNRIVSANLEYSLTALPNNNMIVLGSPGTGKSVFELVPNLLRMTSSYVILDVKGDLLYNYGSYLKKHGYRVKVLNLKNKLQSDGYNPFRYIKNEEDIIRLINNIMESTTPPDAMKGDPFWDDGTMMYLQALFFYVWYEIQFEDRSMDRVLELVAAEAEVLDENGTTRLSLMMEKLTFGTRGKSHPAYDNYKKLKEGAADTVASIVLIVNTKLQLFSIPEVKRIFQEDTMDLKEIGIGRHGDGKTKTALFLVIPDNDTSFNFMISMLYTQLLDVLMYEADMHYHGKLPIPVELWMDEYGNGARPYRYEFLCNTLRSRNISGILLLQSISQLKTLHKGDSWNTIMDSSSAFVFLGAGRSSLDTQKYVADLLGQSTIDKRSEGESRGQHGNNNINFDRIGRELMTAAEIGAMNMEDCIILLAGCSPVYDKKNRPFSLPAFQEAQKMEKYIHPIRCREEKSGEYTTLQAPGSIEILDDASVAYYKELQAQGEPVNFYTITDDMLLELDLYPKEDIDLSEVSKKMLEHQKELEELEEIKRISPFESKDLNEDIFVCIRHYQEFLDEDQLEEILCGLEDGLTQEEVKSYFFLPANQMKKERRLLLLQKEANGNG